MIRAPRDVRLAALKFDHLSVYLAGLILCLLPQKAPVPAFACHAGPRHATQASSKVLKSRLVHVPTFTDTSTLNPTIWGHRGVCLTRLITLLTQPQTARSKVCTIDKTDTASERCSPFRLARGLQSLHILSTALIGSGERI